ncbi:hypothetical protein CR205_07635 [Alteribacter lacisalsi]|uniref:Uncharacterized protein n=1 Tax=Alteribacter lacisalsi TaxID=2045244 RepID=A0A2W0H9D4_9BACI|nr:hypothetical protein [Alteribacter lacisalsi]PYZ98453.1 hypothetical protein CR205_07635 [Alteribacter lacisalsi]
MRRRHYYIYAAGLFCSGYGLYFFHSQPYYSADNMIALLVFSPFSWFTGLLFFTAGFFLFSRVIKAQIDGFRSGSLPHYGAVIITVSVLAFLFGWLALLLAALAFHYGIMDAVKNRDEGK